MHAPLTTQPACFGISYFVPGEGACEAGCRIAKGCRDCYLDAAAAHLGELAPDERLFVLSHRPARLAIVPPAGQEPHRKAPAAWTDERRRPLSSFPARSVPVLAAEVVCAAGRPLHVREIAAEVARIAPARGVRFGGKTPEATVGLALRQVQEVERVGRGQYRWRG